MTLSKLEVYFRTANLVTVGDMQINWHVADVRRASRFRHFDGDTNEPTEVDFDENIRLTARAAKWVRH